MKLYIKIEHVAQRLYDIRDEVPAGELDLWNKIDRKAKELSSLAMVVREKTAQVERLTQALEDAPHADHCKAIWIKDDGAPVWRLRRDGEQKRLCDCWKSRIHTAISTSAPTGEQPAEGAQPVLPKEGT